jgi:uncharacterized membrane protein
MSSDRNDLGPMASVISRIFGIGIVLSAVLLSVGLVLSLIHRSSAQWVLTSGLITLMCIPALRVLVSSLDAIRRRDAILGAATIAVALALVWLIRHQLHPV